MREAQLKHDNVSSAREEGQDEMRGGEEERGEEERQPHLCVLLAAHKPRRGNTVAPAL